MYNNKRLVLSIFWVVLGITLFTLSVMHIISDNTWSGMGGALIGIGILQIIKNVKYRNNNGYKEKVDIEVSDERNKYIRMKAWSWAGYLFVLIAALVGIALFIAGKKDLMQMAFSAECLMVSLYWISYLICSRKY